MRSKQKFSFCVQVNYYDLHPPKYSAGLEQPREELLGLMIQRFGKKNNINLPIFMSILTIFIVYYCMSSGWFNI